MQFRGLEDNDNNDDEESYADDDDGSNDNDGDESSGDNYLGTRLTESPMRRFETRLLTRVSRTYHLNYYHYDDLSSTTLTK